MICLTPSGTTHAFRFSGSHSARMFFPTQSMCSHAISLNMIASKFPAGAQSLPATKPVFPGDCADARLAITCFAEDLNHLWHLRMKSF